MKRILPPILIRGCREGKVDVAVAWGPLAGYFSRNSAVPLDITPIDDDPQHPDLPLSFDIGIGVRARNHALKQRLERNSIARHARSKRSCGLTEFLKLDDALHARRSSSPMCEED